MEQIKIQAYVPQSVAVREGKTKELEEKQRKDAAEKSIRAWASDMRLARRLGLAWAGITDEAASALQRAAREGYDVAEAVADLVVDQIAAYSPGTAFRLLEGTPPYGAAAWEKRPAPRALAFELLDGVRSHLATVEKPAAIELELLDVQRYEVDSDDDDAEKFTAIVVWVRSPVTRKRVVVFKAE